MLTAKFRCEGRYYVRFCDARFISDISLPGKKLTTIKLIRNTAGECTNIDVFVAGQSTSVTLPEPEASCRRQSPGISQHVGNNLAILLFYMRTNEHSTYSFKRAFMFAFKRFLAALLVIMVGLNIVLAQSKQKAPNFSLKTAQGATIELAKLKNKLVVVNFWATWCGPCRAEIPGFLDVYEKYKDKGLEIVGISLDDGGWDDVTPFVKRFNIDYPVVIGDGKIARAYGNIQAIPTTFIVDREGFIVDRHVGYMSKDQLEKRVKSLL